MFDWEDISVFFNDLAVPLTWNGQSFPVLFSRQTDALSMNANGQMITAIGRFDLLGTLTTGETVEVNGDQFTVVEIHRLQDGKLVKFILEEQ